MSCAVIKVLTMKRCASQGHKVKCHVLRDYFLVEAVSDR